jgi:hypothetical protein
LETERETIADVARWNRVDSALRFILLDLKGLEIMRLRSTALLAAGTLALASTLLASNDARACGGCFHVASTTESTVVTAHRMAFAVSPTHTVLWDQVQYSGNPAEFAWVLPVKAGARVEVSTDAWFEALDAATSARVISPSIDCPGTGSGSSGCSLGCASQLALSAGGDSVKDIPQITVVHQGTVGPYESVTLHATVPGALPKWLTSHGFAIDAAIQPIVDAYTKEGFDFIALRLLPGKGVQQMQPVRIVSPGMSPTLPLRMVAAGTGANVDITLFVIGEGAWIPQNFPVAVVSPGALSWDFKTGSSNYATLRRAVLAGGDGRTWNEAFAIKSSLLSPLTSPIDESTITYQIGSLFPQTIAEAYIQQGLANGEGLDDSCIQAFTSVAGSLDQVVNPCVTSDGSGGGGGSGGAGAGGSGGAGGGALICGTVGAGKIDARTLACGKLDDVAAAMDGLHPHDVTITRLEGSLPRAALATDLVLQAAINQGDISNWFNVTDSTNTPTCPSAGPPVIGGDSGRKGPWNRNRWALFASVLAALLATLGRRATRPTVTARAH